MQSCVKCVPVLLQVRHEREFTPLYRFENRLICTLFSHLICASHAKLSTNKRHDVELLHLATFSITLDSPINRDLAYGLLTLRVIKTTKLGINLNPIIKGSITRLIHVRITQSSVVGQVIGYNPTKHHNFVSIELIFFKYKICY